MFAALRTLFTKWTQSPPKAIESAAPEQKPSIPEFLLAHHDDENQPSPLVPYDENLLERARTQWQFGDWQSLSRMNRDTLKHHPDRAKLALLAAAGRLQTGNDAEAKAYIRLAQDWGVSETLISQVLIAVVHNSIGRAAAIGNQQHRALQTFENGIAIGTPGSAKELVANTRANLELDTLDLLPGSHGRLQQYHASADLAKQAYEPGKTNNPTLRPGSEAHAFYINLGQAHQDKPIPFLLIDSKSLPRSGLHYLKNTLNKVFGEHFSFCEWYNETGCCKQMPCTLTGFATHAQETRELRIRLIKSHDFYLTDPVYPTNPYLRRLVIVRDPLYILTSWFALAQLDTHKAILANNGINVSKIWLLHEKEVLDPAYRLLNEHFTPPTLAQLSDWLESNSRYIAGFMEKWIKPAIDQSESHVEVVRYEDVNHFIGTLAGKFLPYVSDGVAEAIDKAIGQTGQQFKKREDPFSAPADKLSSYLRSNAQLFTKFAETLISLEPYQALMKSQPSSLEIQ
jgi:hypothetical protein